MVVILTIVEGSERFPPGESWTIARERSLRALPGRREVFRARVGERGVALVKHDIHPRKAEADARAEWTWLTRLASAGIAVPQPYFLGRAEDGSWAVAMQFLESVRPMDACEDWSMEDLVACVRRVHAAGFLQTDLHLGNFLVDADRVLWVIDASSHRCCRGERDRLANWALLRANVTVDRWEAFDRALGEPDAEVVRRRMPKVQRERMRRYRKKCVRTCSAFVRIEDSEGLCVMKRGWDEPELLALRKARVEDLESRLVTLKKASKCLVARGDRWVIKTHWGTRGRARRAWLGGHALRLLGFQTPEPLAYWESRDGHRDGLLMEIDEGQPLQEWVRGNHAPVLRAKVAREVASFLEVLEMLHWSHGDTKASNFHVGPKGDLRVIDLDSFTWEGPRWRRRVAKDDERFRRNARKFPEGKDIFDYDRARSAR